MIALIFELFCAKIREKRSVVRAWCVLVFSASDQMPHGGPDFCFYIFTNSLIFQYFLSFRYSEIKNQGRVTFPVNIFMILAGWEVRIGKNCDRGLENAFSSLRSQFFPIPAGQFYRSFSYCRKLAYKWVCLRNFAIESAYPPSTTAFAKGLTSEERASK